MNHRDPRKLADLPPAILERVRACRWDRIIEKHEGPAGWKYHLDHAEFLRVGALDVLLPLDATEQLPNVTVLRHALSSDGELLTLFLKDTTYVSRAEDERFAAGFLAVCQRFPGETFFVAIAYHEWFLPTPEELPAPLW